MSSTLPRAHTLRNFRIDESTGRYLATRPLSEEQIITAARTILARRVVGGEQVTSIAIAADYLMLHLSDRKRETMAALFLNNSHRVIAYEELFYGTIDGASVHPRVIVQQALEHNAAAVLLAHNHPSDALKPSVADKRITERTMEALSLVEVRLLDHVVITRQGIVSVIHDPWEKKLAKEPRQRQRKEKASV